MKMLVGVDGSAGGFAAAHLAGKLLAAPQDQLALYYSPPDVRSRASASAEIVVRARQALADAVFAEAKAQLPAGLQTGLHTIVGTRNPRQGLLLAADEWRADVLVVGARGSGPIANLLLGSVSNSVARAASIPVLVARPLSAGETVDGLSVLLAYDGSRGSEQAVALLSRFQWPSDSRGRVMTVVESMTAGAEPEWLRTRVRNPEIEAMAKVWAHEHEQEKVAQRQILAKLCQKLPVSFQQSDPLVCEGHAAEQILQAAANERADLIVLGSRGKGTLERWFIGSTSDKVLSQATCSVLLVPEREPV